MFDDLITHRPPPPKREGSCEGDTEHHFSEGAIMVAFAMHLLRTVPGLARVAIHPDGEHGKQFDFRSWLQRHGFAMTEASGKTMYGGIYSSPSGKVVVVDPSSGRGDVVAETEGQNFVAECKGGVINTKHAGQQSRLRKGLCEAVGLLMASPVANGRRQFAVVPLTKTTQVLARRMAQRAGAAGIDIALVDRHGTVNVVRAE
jgi:hypothetical protein